ncbi:MAG: Rpn family recombination-promoting nuclease/putative transposase [Thiomargarita sp.]|nr:Rpn family recombination-promoting nuclease/putative transposase [Thiomargarita sp.]
MINPKSHDSLFKWLITAFTREFFEHYFPEIMIGKYTFIDKEFISKYETLKESLKGDLFLAMEVEVDGILREIVIQIEHQSEKEDISERVYEYSCYAWLLKKKPVWSIVIYTDDAVWRKQITNRFWYAFDSQNGKQYHHFDVIKVKAEKSSDLIKKHSLMCKLLTLKADDKKANPDELVYEIYKAAAAMKGELTNEQLLLIEQWVSFYKKVSEQRLDKIKKEVKMSFIETTITEHVYNQGWMKGEAEGKAEGEAEGKKETAINLLKMGIDVEIINKATGFSKKEIKQLICQ